MLRLASAGIELAGIALIVLCLFLIEPLLLIGAGGLVVIRLGTALAEASEKPE